MWDFDWQFSNWNKLRNFASILLINWTWNCINFIERTWDLKMKRANAFPCLNLCHKIHFENENLFYDKIMLQRRNNPKKSFFKSVVQLFLHLCTLKTPICGLWLFSPKNNGLLSFLLLGHLIYIKSLLK